MSFVESAKVCSQSNLQTFMSAWLDSVYPFTQTVSVSAADGQHHSFYKHRSVPLHAVFLRMANNLDGHFSINTTSPLIQIKLHKPGAIS